MNDTERYIEQIKANFALLLPEVDRQVKIYEENLAKNTLKPLP